MPTHSGLRTAALVLALVAIARAETPSSVDIKDIDGQLQISIAGHPFTTYRYTAKPDDPKWDRPYFYPVLAGDGTPVTSDPWRLSQTQKTDHPWHRSLYVGWATSTVSTLATLRQPAAPPLLQIHHERHVCRIPRLGRKKRRPCPPGPSRNPHRSRPHISGRLPGH